jgi:quinol monooxygenase YgiN
MSMRWTTVALALMMLSVTKGAQSSGRVFIVTHVDLMQPFAEEGATMLRAFAAAARKDAGSLRYEILQEPSRHNHITIVSAWQSRELFEKHLAQPHTRALREKLQPMLGGPLDERLHEMIE